MIRGRCCRNLPFGGGHVEVGIAYEQKATYDGRMHACISIHVRSYFLGSRQRQNWTKKYHEYAADGVTLRGGIDPGEFRFRPRWATPQLCSIPALLGSSMILCTTSYIYVRDALHVVL